MKPSPSAARSALCTALCALALGAAPAAHAQADTSHVIDFEDLAEGTAVSGQYAAWGVSFSANARTGTDSPTGGWATNTDLTVVSSSGADVGDLYGPALVSGHILRSYEGWLLEDGDASFAVLFSQPVSSISVDFAGIGRSVGITGLEIYSPQDILIGRVLATSDGQQRLSFSGGSIGRVVVLPGYLDDWVAVDNIRFTIAGAVPEPASVALLAAGLGVVGLAMRRRAVRAQK